MTLLLAVSAALSIVAITVWSLGQAFSGMNDPCAIWGQAPDEPGAVSVSIGPHDPCKVKAVHSRSKGQTATLAALVPGGLLAFTLLAVAGAAFSRRRVLIAGAIGVLVETLFVFTIFPLTLLVGISFLLLARRF